MRMTKKSNEKKKMTKEEIIRMKVQRRNKLIKQNDKEHRKIGEKENDKRRKEKL